MTDINSRDINNSSDSEASMSTVEARPESVKKPDGSIARRKRNKKEGSSDSSAAQSGAHKAQKDEGVLPSYESQDGNKDQKKAKKLTHITEHNFEGDIVHTLLEVHLICNEISFRI